MCEQINIQVSKPARKCLGGEMPLSHSNNSYHGSVGSLLWRAKQARNQNHIAEANRLGYHYRKKVHTSVVFHSSEDLTYYPLNELAAKLSSIRMSIRTQGGRRVLKYRIKGPNGTTVAYYRGIRPVANTAVHLAEAKMHLQDLEVSAFSFASDAWVEYQERAETGTRLMQTGYNYNRSAFGWNVPADGFPRSSFVHGQDITPPKFVKSSQISSCCTLHCSDKNTPLWDRRLFYWRFSMGHIDIDLRKPLDLTEPYDFTWEERHTIDPYVRWLPDGTALVKLLAGSDDYLADSRAALRELLGRIHRFTSQTFIGDFIVANLPEFYPLREVDPCEVEFDLNTDLERFWQACGDSLRFEEVYYGKVLDVLDGLIARDPPIVNEIPGPIRSFFHTPLVRNSTFGDEDAWSRHVYPKPITPL